MVFGAVWNSIALLSDGFHNLADSGAFFIALFASIADRHGFGGKDARMNVLGGLINCSITLVLTFCAAIEAFHRIWPATEGKFTPEIKPLYYMIAIGGILMNGFGAIFLGAHGHSHGGLSCTAHGEAHNHIHPKKSSNTRTYGDEPAAHPPSGGAAQLQQPPQPCCHGHFAFGHGHSHSHSHSHGPPRPIAGLYQNPELGEEEQLLDLPVRLPREPTTATRRPHAIAQSPPIIVSLGRRADLGVTNAFT
jgi:Co/Zn/Cd efflux system component